mmetsp:Transcript_46624/g.83433  ORF Transcript_46624/g.83433 Transcript_46624/m.83433 type:complete len:203 (+) Transcript_46624:662-1270(+)
MSFLASSTSRSWSLMMLSSTFTAFLRCEAPFWVTISENRARDWFSASSCSCCLRRRTSRWAASSCMRLISAAFRSSCFLTSSMSISRALSISICSCFSLRSSMTRLRSRMADRSTSSCRARTWKYCGGRAVRFLGGQTAETHWLMTGSRRRLRRASSPLRVSVLIWVSVNVMVPVWWLMATLMPGYPDFATLTRRGSSSANV